ncbi:PncC family amidohydrolase [Paucimonas lemoignei]|uniref:PncC family amidohydrolase n=1 Tax=Paucimonas lemoignei TaxID=29443 RepID=A0A4R3HU76_PAULE|nr:CinA family protein [Paucimonas lemoignei]TCS36244.1 PncC family amidohydrolase [Paucimonas lemoignei]
MENLKTATEFFDKHDLTVVTAESCTAGLIAGSLADLPGCGKWFKSGYVTYSPEAKMHILGVKKETIERFNLTSEEVAREMVEGTLRISEANVAVANTGVAGPDKGEGGIPAGTVCFAWAFRMKDRPRIFSEKRHFGGDRNAVRQAAAEYAITRIPALYECCVNDSAQSGNPGSEPGGQF